jgi:hypothetical protein
LAKRSFRNSGDLSKTEPAGIAGGVGSTPFFMTTVNLKQQNDLSFQTKVID